MDVKEWQDRLEKTFTGPSGVIGERVLNIHAREKELGNRYAGTFHGFQILTDSFMDFSFRTLALVAQANPGPQKLQETFFVASHVNAFWRSRASYLLFYRGYHAESVSLLRGVWELTNCMIAVKKGVVLVEDLFGGRAAPGASPENLEPIRKEAQMRMQSAESRVFTYILGEKSGISEDGRRGLDSVRRILHASVHRSGLNFARYWAPWIRGEKALTLMPVYDEDMVSLNMNLMEFVHWPLVKTMAYLQPMPDSVDPKWSERFAILDDSYRYSVAAMPKITARAVEEFVRVHC